MDIRKVFGIAALKRWVMRLEKEVTRLRRENASASLRSIMDSDEFTRRVKAIIRERETY